MTNIVNRLREKLLSKQKRDNPRPQALGVVFETLEPRLLMSADPIVAAAALAEPATLAPTQPTVISAGLLHTSTAGQLAAQQDSAKDESATATESRARREVVFVDSRVEHYEQFLQDFLASSGSDRQMEVRLLDPERDGIEQISAALAEYRGLDAVHFISHGVEGAALLGSTWLDEKALQTMANAVAGWGKSLNADADLLFYGCNLAASSTGAALLEKLSLLTDADVAASNDPTGASALGGDWILESSVGSIETRVAPSDQFQQHWDALLAAPTASNLNAAETYTLNTPLNLANIVVTDVDSAAVTVTLTLSDPSAGSLSTGTSGAVTSTYNAGTGVWTASGAVADVNALLADLTFTPTPLYLLPFTISTSVDDGVSTISGSKSMTVSLVNLPPSATNLNAAETYTEDTPLDLTDIVASDLDSPNVTASLTLSDPLAGSLNTAASGAVLSTYNAATGVWSASGAKADVNALLAGLTFTPSLNYNSDFTIATSVDDGVAAAITGVKTMTAVAVNDAPTATNLSAAESYTEDTPLDLTDIVVSDVDSANVTVTLTLSDPSAGALNVGTSGAVTSTYNAGTGMWTASGAKADVNTLLAGLTFTPALNYNSDFTIATSVDDGVAPAVTGVKNVTGTAVNDAPANSVPGPQSTPQDTPLRFDASNGNPVAIGDVDAGSGQVEVTLTVTNGTVTLSWPSATATAAGSEFRVNTTTSDRQATLNGEFYGATTNDFGSTRSVASDANGNFVVVWSSKNEDGDGWGIYAQRYDAAGVAQGGAFRVNTTVSKDQVHGAVAMDDAGNFVIAWASKDQDGDNWGIYAQRYDATGLAQGAEFLVNTYTAKEQLGPSVAMDSSGDFVIAWSSKDQDGDNWGVYAKRYDAGGVVQGGEFRVNTYTTKEQMFPSVAMDAEGNFVVTWSSKDQDGDNWGVYAQRYNASGVAQGSAFLVNQTTAKEQMVSSVAMDTDGDFVITWSSKDQDGSGWGVYARQFDAAGVAKTGETLVNTTIAGDQEYSTVAMDAKGNFVVAWTGNGAGDTLGVFAQRFTIASPLTFTAGDGTRDTTMTFRGTLAEINSLVDGMIFTPTAGFNGPASINVTTTDLGNSGSGGTGSDSDTININVGSANVAPTVTLSGGALNYTENDPATVIDGVATVSDPDSADLDGGQLTVFFSGGGTDGDRLAIRDQGIAAGQIGVSGSDVTYNFGAGSVVIGSFTGGTDGVTPLIVTLNANATATAVQALIRNVTYQNVSDNPSTLDRIVQFNLNDGDGGISGASRSIAFVAVNDAPAASNLSAGETYTEDTPLDLTDIVVSDVDSANVTATLTLSDPSAGSLSTATSGSVTSTYNVATGVWTASGSPGDVNALLAGLTFTPALNYNSDFTIATSVDDGVSPAITGIKNMTGSAVNDAPVLADNALAISEGGSVILSGGEISATDVDTASGSLTFTVSGVSGGRFEMVADPGVAITSFTQAEVASGGVRFVHDGGEVAPSYSVTVSDGSSADGPAAAVVNFTNVNDAPTASNLNASETYTEDTPLDLADIVVSDIDSANVSVALTLSDPSAGSLSTGTSGSVTSTYNSGTGAWTASGAIADVNALLAGLTFTPALNYDGDFTIATSVDDGVAPAITGTKTMTAVAVNDAPTASNLNAAETYTEDTPLDLTDIVVSEVDSANVTVTLALSDASAGTLNTGTSGAVTSTYNSSTGVWTASGAIANVNTLLAGLTFTPALNYNSDFTIATSVDDGVAPALTGMKNVTAVAVNDAPTASNLNAAETYTEDTPLALTDIVVNDIDSANVSVTLTLSDPSAGSLNTGTSGAVTSTYNSGTGAWTASGAIADVNALLAGLTFTPALNYDGDFTIATSVDDGVAAAITGVKSVTAVGLDDAPVLGNNSLTVGEGGSVVLSSADLSASDPDDASGTLTFTVSALSGGRFELVSNPGVAIGSFTQAQVAGGAVRFVHDGAEAAPSYDVTVSDGTSSDGPAAAAVTFTNVNDAPVLGNNRLLLTQGATVVLTAAELSATDADSAAPTLLFTISNVSAGRFELVSNPGVEITSFTQAQIASGAVRFIHDGGSAAPSYEVTVSDGSLSFGPSAAAISFMTAEIIVEETPPPIPLPPVIQPGSGPASPTIPGVIIEPVDPEVSRGSSGTGVGGGGTDNSQPSNLDLVSLIGDFQISDNNTGAAAEPVVHPSRPLPARFADKPPADLRQTSSLRTDAAPTAPDAPADSTALASGDLGAVVDVNGFTRELNRLRDEVAAENYLDEVVVGSSLTVATGFSIGYVLWLVRGEILLSSLLASLPAWRLVDPLPVLSFLGKRSEQYEEDDSIEATVKKGAAQPEPEARTVTPSPHTTRSVKWRMVMQPDSISESGS